MLEIVLSVAVVLVLLASVGGEGVAGLLFGAGAAAIAIGMIGGVPAGAAYHILLLREVSKRGTAPSGWWWHPTRLHEGLPDDARRRIAPWFRAGAAGFLIALTGCALILAALLAQ